MPIEPPFKDLFQPGFVRSYPAFRDGLVALERLNRLRAVSVLQVDAENCYFGHGSTAFNLSISAAIKAPAMINLSLYDLLIIYSHNELSHLNGIE